MAILDIGGNPFYHLKCVLKVLGVGYKRVKRLQTKKREPTGAVEIVRKKNIEKNRLGDIIRT